MKNELTVQDIFIYPIKSLGGIRLEKARVEERGFQFDRRWMLVDQSGGFISQRTYPKLALLKVSLEEDSLKVVHLNDPSKVLKIPILNSEGPEIEVRVWEDQVLAKVVNVQTSRWFSDFLGFETHLVVMPETSIRKVDPRYAVQGESVSFADGMPYLLIGQESLNDLNSKLDHPVPMDRFRPNLVFSGGMPYEEDSLKKIKIGKLNFNVVKPCARCIMITVDQDKGQKGVEPLKTLSTFRTMNNKVYFGQNMIALETGEINVGDSIQTL
jgi:uncharacterized protein